MSKGLQNLSLRGKLTLILTLTSCLFVLFTMVTIIALQWWVLSRDLLSRAELVAKELSDRSAVTMALNDRQEASLILQGLASRPQVVGAKLITKNNEIFAEFYQNSSENSLGTTWQPAANLLQRYIVPLTSIEAIEPVIYGEEILGQLMIRFDLVKINQLLIQYVGFASAAFILYSLLAFLIANRLQRLITDPVHSLVLSMKKVTREKNYRYRVHKTSDDEFGSLFDGFNSMLSELEIRDKELRENESRLDYLAYHDPLTKLANRHLFHDRLEHSMTRAKRMKSRVAILFIDLDRFKHINDSFGHDAGDRVLCAVAERLQEQVRAADTLARLGGDEFVIVLEQLKKTEDLSRFVQRVLRDLVEPIVIAEQKLHVTASIGISLYPENGEDVDSLISAADIAMYQAKENGSNTYRFYSAEMNTHSRESLLLENQLRGALLNNQLVLHYQPQFELKTGRLLGFEALIRWNNPDLGFVSPVDFIPLAEESGLIVSIGEWVLMTACQTLKRLQTHWQLPLRMAVNISPRQFQHDSLVQTVAEALYRNQLEPALLELEVTESMVMNNVERAINKMDEFNKMGVQLAIDDFGTGYSSLGYLKKFPISRLKIDQSFIKDLANNSSDQAIVNSIIALGKNMSLEIIAEGIETVEQHDFLKKEGCDQGQGFLMGKPMAEAELSTLLDSVVLSSPEVLTRIMKTSAAS